MIARGTREIILDALWPVGRSARMEVWTILDAARDERIFSAVDGSYLEKSCLYSGYLPWQLQMAAPYLVQLKKDDRLTEYVLDLGWGQAWGIFLRSETSMKALRNHLRRFLRVRDRAGRRLIFRYYDPRVMRVYLPTCHVDELKTVYGPIEQYICEDEEGETMLEYGFDGLQLSQRRIPLGLGAATPGVTARADP